MGGKLSCCCCCGPTSSLRPTSRVCTIGVYGCDNAGKTTVIHALCGESLDGVSATVGFKCYECKRKPFSAVRLYDVGGGPRIRDIWNSYYAEIHGVVFVVDAQDTDRLDEVKRSLYSVLANPLVHSKPILLLLNKQDGVRAIDEVDADEKLELVHAVSTYRTPCMIELCQATMGSGKTTDRSIQAGFSWLLQRIDSEWAKLDSRIRQDIQVEKERNAEKRRQTLERVRKRQAEEEAAEAAADGQMANGHAATGNGHLGNGHVNHALVLDPAELDDDRRDDDDDDDAEEGKDQSQHKSSSISIKSNRVRPFEPMPLITEEARSRGVSPLPPLPTTTTNVVTVGSPRSNGSSSMHRTISPRKSVDVSSQPTTEEPEDDEDASEILQPTSSGAIVQPSRWTQHSSLQQAQTIDSQLPAVSPQVSRRASGLKLAPLPLAGSDQPRHSLTADRRSSDLLRQTSDVSSSNAPPSVAGSTSVRSSQGLLSPSSSVVGGGASTMVKRKRPRFKKLLSQVSESNEPTAADGANIPMKHLDSS